MSSTLPLILRPAQGDSTRQWTGSARDRILPAKTPDLDATQRSSTTQLTTGNGPSAPMTQLNPRATALVKAPYQILSARNTSP